MNPQTLDIANRSWAEPLTPAPAAAAGGDRPSRHVPDPASGGRRRLRRRLRGRARPAARSLRGQGAAPRAHPQPRGDDPLSPGGGDHLDAPPPAHRSGAGFQRHAGRLPLSGDGAAGRTAAGDACWPSAARWSRRRLSASSSRSRRRLYAAHARGHRAPRLEARQRHGAQQRRDAGLREGARLRDLPGQLAAAPDRQHARRRARPSTWRPSRRAGCATRSVPGPTSSRWRRSRTRCSPGASPSAPKIPSRCCTRSFTTTRRRPASTCRSGRPSTPRSCAAWPRSRRIGSPTS